MSVSPEYREWILEQFREMGTVTARSMFGGVGLYHDGLIFALLSDDTLYLKADDGNRPDFEAAGMEPFRPYGDHRSMQYYTVPVDVLEDPGRLGEWGRGAVEAARRKKKQ